VASSSYLLFTDAVLTVHIMQKSENEKYKNKSIKKNKPALYKQAC
jgi:hypothetical protein